MAIRVGKDPQYPCESHIQLFVNYCHIPHGYCGSLPTRIAM